MPPAGPGKPGKWLDDDSVFEYHRDVIFELREKTIDLVVQMADAQKTKTNVSLLPSMTVGALSKVLMSKLSDPSRYGLFVPKKRGRDSVCS